MGAPMEVTCSRGAAEFHHIPWPETYMCIRSRVSLSMEPMKLYHVSVPASVKSYMSRRVPLAKSLERYRAEPSTSELEVPTKIAIGELRGGKLTTSRPS